MSAETTLTAERRHQKEAECGAMLGETALAEVKRRQEETTKKQRRADDQRNMAPVLPPNPGNAEI